MSSYWIWLVVSTASMEASSYFLGWTSPGKWQNLQALNCRYLYSLCWCLFRLHVFCVQTTRWQHVSPSYSHSNVQFHLKIPPITRKRMRASSLKINDLFQFIADLIPNRTEIIKTCLKSQPKYIYMVISTIDGDKIAISRDMALSKNRLPPATPHIQWFISIPSSKVHF